MNDSRYQPLLHLMVPFLLGWFLVGTSGFDLLPDVGVFDGKRVLQVFTLCLVLLAMLATRDVRGQATGLTAAIPGWMLATLVLPVVLGGLSALRFENPAYGLLEIALPVLMVFAAFATAASCRLQPTAFDRLALLVIIAVGLLTVLIEMMGMVVAWSARSEFSFSKMLIRFAHPRFYNQLQTFSIPLLAALPFVFPKLRRARGLAASLLGLQWGLLLISGGRGTVLAVTIALTFAAWWFPSTRRYWMGVHLSGLAIGLALFLCVLAVNQSLAPAGGTFVQESVGRQMTHSSGRRQMWELAVREAWQNPWLGSGPAQFACEWPATTPSHPHSFPFTVLAEWGIPSFMAIMSVCAWLAWRLVIRARSRVERHHPPDVLTAMLTASLLAAGVHAGLSGVLIMPASQVMTILVCGWALGRLTPDAEPAVDFLKPTSWTMAGGLLLAIAICIFSVNEVRHRDTRFEAVRKSGLFMPRYWHYGRSCRYIYATNPDKPGKQ